MKKKKNEERMKKLIFKAKKVMNWKDYLLIKEKLEDKNTRLVIKKFMIAPAEITANRTEVILDLEIEDLEKRK